MHNTLSKPSLLNTLFTLFAFGAYSDAELFTKSETLGLFGIQFFFVSEQKL
jgi:hypothetical protein